MEGIQYISQFLSRTAIAFYGLEYLKDFNLINIRLVLEQIYLEILLKASYIKTKVDELRTALRCYGLKYFTQERFGITKELRRSGIISMETHQLKNKLMKLSFTPKHITTYRKSISVEKNKQRSGLETPQCMGRKFNQGGRVKS